MATVAFWRQCVIVGAMLLAAAPVAAQAGIGPGEGFGDRPRIGIGYVANAPHMLGGASVYVLTDVLGGLGLYLDGKMSLDSPADEPHYVDSLTVRDVEQLPAQAEDNDGFDWWSVNAALTRPITPELMLYAGAGYTYQDAYRRFRDPEMRVTEFGRYWVRDEADTGGRLNLMAGAFFRLTEHVAVQFGAESEPGGFTVGGSYSFSIR